MKLDLIEINELSPPGLWDLEVLVATISMLRRVISAGIGRSALLYGQMILQYSESLREQTRDNLNMRIKAWVLQCPNRIAFVHSIIGKAAIENWRKNRLADYALRRYFGDWKRKFSDGFSHGVIRPKLQFMPKCSGQMRAYKWKLFALVKIINVRGFLYRKHGASTDEQEMRDAYFRLWGVVPEGDKILRKWTQPRGARILKPIRFTPNELEIEPEQPEQAAEIEPLMLAAQDAPKRIEGDVQPEPKTHEPLPERRPP